MLNKKLLTIVIILTSASCMCMTKDKQALEKRVLELEQKVKDCQQKKLALLKQCDANGCLQRINNLQEYVNDCEQARQERHREISALQRTIAEHNRKLLASMTPENKRILRQLLREYAKLYRELCKYNQCEERQPDAFELFFI